jgi:DNA-binding NarL/FixJ family response regulator
MDMTFYVIEDHPLMREALSQRLRYLRPGAKIVEMDCLAPLAGAIEEQGPPELICLDLGLPDVVTGLPPGVVSLAGIARVRQICPNVPLAVISGEKSAQFEDRCLAAGANVYLEKTLDQETMSAALRFLLSPDTVLDAEATDAPKLSRRQQDLIIMLDQGLSNREIGDKLGISEHTVKIHMWRLFKRLNVSSRIQALNHARAHGLLPR